MAAQADRRLVPIVSLDVVGYSRLTEINERQTLRLVQRVYDRLVARTIGRQDGKVFKTMGDGLLAEFQSVVMAVEWVAEVQRELNERRLKAPGGGFLQIRAGVVLADVLVAGDDLYGSGVNLSVRVQALAPPGGMAITKWMYQYLDGRSDLQFTDMGPTELKNVSRTVTALTALASAMMQLGGDVRQAVNFVERALSLDPNHSWAWMRRGYGQVYLGQPEEGLKAFEQSLRLSPIDPFSFNVHLGMGLAHFSAGRPDRAIEMARQALAERPGLTWPYRDLATYYAAAGKLEQAKDALEKFVYLRPVMTAATTRDGLRFMEPELLERYVAGLEQAGLA